MMMTLHIKNALGTVCIVRVSSSASLAPVLMQSAMSARCSKGSHVSLHAVLCFDRLLALNLATLGFRGFQKLHGAGSVAAPNAHSISASGLAEAAQSVYGLYLATAYLRRLILDFHKNSLEHLRTSEIWGSVSFSSATRASWRSGEHGPKTTMSMKTKPNVRPVTSRREALSWTIIFVFSASLHIVGPSRASR